LALLVALVGVLVGGYAYTGDRIYRIQYLPMALFGLALVVAGSSLAGYGQANRPRLGGRQDDEEPSAFRRLRTWLADLVGDDEEKPAVQADSEADDADAAS
jgi:hypothetical protein